MEPHDTRFQTSDTPEDEDSRLDCLLGRASYPAPSPGLADRVLDAIHEQDERDARWAELIAAPRRYTRLKHWSAGIAACAALTLTVLGLMEHFGSQPAMPMQDQAISIAEEILLDEALGSIDNAELLSAIYSVSSGRSSVSTGLY